MFGQVRSTLDELKRATVTMCASVIGRHLITRTPPPNLPPRMSVEAIFRLNNDRGYCVIAQEPRSWFQQMSNTCPILLSYPRTMSNKPRRLCQNQTNSTFQKHRFKSIVQKSTEIIKKNVQKIMLKNFQNNTPKSSKIMTNEY